MVSAVLNVAHNSLYVLVGGALTFVLMHFTFHNSSLFRELLPASVIVPEGGAFMHKDPAKQDFIARAI